MARGSTLLNKMTAIALVKKPLLTEFPPEQQLAQRQVNFTELPPMVSSTNFAHWFHSTEQWIGQSSRKETSLNDLPPEPMIQNVQ